MCKKITILLGLILCFMSFGVAESLRFKTLNTSHGLPQNTIRAIIQDQNGFMWFATEDGIARYDGHSIKNYRYHHNDPHSLPENVAYQFLIENENRLWVSTQGGGISVLDFSKDRFDVISERSNTSAEKSMGNNVSALYQRNNGEILAGSVNGVFRISTKSLQVMEQLVTNKELKNKRNRVINNIWEDKENNIWITLFDGGVAYLTSDRKTKIIKSFGSGKIFGKKDLKSIGTILITGKEGLWKLDYDQKKLRPFLKNIIPKNSDVRDIAQSTDKKLWIATQEGLIQYDPHTNIALHIKNNPHDQSSIPSDKLNKLYIDKNNILWIGSDKGISYLNLKDYGFTTFSAYDPQIIYPPELSTKSTNNLDSNMIWSLFRDSVGTLWVGTNKGLSFQKKGKYSFENITTIGINDSKIKLKSIWSIAQTGKYLWFGTWGNGLIRYSPDTKETLVYSSKSNNKKNQLSGDVIRLLLYDKKRNSLWVGTHHNGLNQIDFNSGKITHFLPNKKNKNAIPHERIRALYLDLKNNIWVGTGDGLIVYDEKYHTFKRVKNQIDQDNLDVRGIYQSNENTLWYASGYGLNRVNITDMEVDKKFLEGDGLAHSTLYGMTDDLANKLWLITMNGLSRFDMKTYRSKSFFDTHNLQANEFNFNVIWKEKDGSIIVGGGGGITQFDPKKVNENYKMHLPMVTSIRSYDKKLREKQILSVAKYSKDKKTKITLNKKYRKIAIDVSIPEYIIKDNIKYKYRLLGNDSNWTVSNKGNNTIQYTNLKPKIYTFQIRKNNDNKILSIDLEIKPYFYEKLWFIILLIILFILLIAITSMYFTHKKETQKTKRKKIDSERREAREKHNIYSMIIHDLRPSIKRNKQYLSDIKKYNILEIKELMNNMERENKYSLNFIEKLRSFSTIEKSYSEEKELLFLEEIIDESCAVYQEYEERIIVSKIPDVSVYMYTNNIEFIVINLLSNAIKYSSNIIHLYIKSHGKNLTICVSDQGKGITKALENEDIFKPHWRGEIHNKEGLGLGLSLVKQIALKYEGHIKAKNNSPQGAIITVFLKNVIYEEADTK